MKTRLFAVLLGITLFWLLTQPAVAVPQVTRATLPNGLRVVIVRDPLAPVVTTVMNYQVGSDDEHIEGLAHASEHMMFRGSKSLSEAQFAQVSSVLGGSANADTQNNVTQYYFTVPSQYLDLALHLEASRAHDVLDSQKSWNVERGAIKQEVTRDNSDAGYRLYCKLLKNVFAGTPYADPGLGTLESFNNQVNSPELQRFYHQWYHPNNAILVVAGDVDPGPALASITRLFGDIPSAPVPAHRGVTLSPLHPATYTDQSDHSYTEVTLAYRFPGYADPDFAASQVLSDVLNSQRADLVGLVASGYAQDTSFSSQSFTHGSMALATIDVAPTVKPADAQRRLMAVLAKYRRRGVPAKLVRVAIKREIAAAEFRADSIQGLAFDWSTALAVEHRNSPHADVEAIRHVTVADVNAVLRKYIVPDTASVAVSVPNNQGKTGAAQGKSPENNHIVPPANTPLPEWATSALHVHVPSPTIHPVDLKLPNGIRLIVVPESISHTVVVDAAIRTNTGLQEASGTDGVASLTDNLMAYGSKTYSRLDYQAELDKIAASVSTGRSFSLACLSSDFNRGMQLLADEELHPAFRPADFKIVKHSLYDEVLGGEKTPNHLEAVALLNALYPKGDPARRFATPTTVKHLTLDNVRAWFHQAYRPDLTTIVIVGDVTPSVARATVEQYFGSWKANGPTPHLDNPSIPSNPAKSLRIADHGRVQDDVTLAETLSLTRKDPDYPILQLANVILSAGDTSLLYHDLRDVRGYVYYVGSSVFAGRTRGLFYINFGASPANTPAATAAALRDLAFLQNTLMPKDRLTRARALWLNGLPLQEASFQGVAGHLLSYALQSLPLDQGVRDARRALEVGRRKLRAVVRKWLRPDGFVQVTKGPATH